MRINRILLPVSFLSATFAAAQTPNTPFQHVIIVVQENRTPDNLFGYDLHEPNGQRRLPNAHLALSGPCESTCGCPNNSRTLQPVELDSCFDPDHSHAQSSYDQYIPGAWETMYDLGAMDGACAETLWCSQNGKQVKCPVSGCSSPTNYPPFAEYSYVDNAPVPCPAPGCGNGIVEPYFQIATNYGYANWMFQTNQGPSFEAHQFLFTGTSAPVGPGGPGDQCGSGQPCYHKWFAAELLYHDQSKAYGCVTPAGAVALEEDPSSNESPGFMPPWYPWLDAGYPCYEHNTLADLLGTNGLTWRFYSNTPGSGQNPQGSLWDAPNAIDHICQPQQQNGQWTCSGPDWPGQVGYNGNIVINPTQILTDLGANSSTCNLQPVSWVIPDGTWSDHPGNTGDAGPSWVAAIINAVGGYWYDANNQQHNTACWNNGAAEYWSNTVVLVTWDDWGGFYDDVMPWDCNAQGVCSGYSNGTGQQYVYGFRVPLLVVSAWTPPGYVSGSPNGPVQPYVHDFGSILNFAEWALGYNQTSIGEISPSYHYADYLAPDVYPSCPKTQCTQSWSLADFFLPFNTGTMRTFTLVNGWKYPTAYFLSPSTYFPNTYPSDPDDDGMETQ